MPTLSANEKAQLKPFLKALSQFDVYEVSKIERQLEGFDFSRSPALEA